MPRKRSSKRRSSPVAALVAVLILGSAAVALDSQNLPQQDSQAAAVLIAQGTQTPAPSGEGSGTPSGGERAECLPGVDYYVGLKDGKTHLRCNIRFTCTSPGGNVAKIIEDAKKGGCDEVVASGSPIGTESQCRGLTDADKGRVLQSLGTNSQGISGWSVIGRCGPGDKVGIGTTGAGNPITAVIPSSAPSGEGANQPLVPQQPLQDGSPIVDSFNPGSTPTIGDPIPGAPPISDLNQPLPLPERNPARGDEFPADATDVPRTSTNLGPTGTVLNCPGGPGCPEGAWSPQANQQNCPGGPGCQGGTWNPETQTFGGSAQNCPGGPGCQGGTWDPRTQTIQQQPPAQQCSWLQRNVTGCSSQGQGGGNWLTSLLGTPTAPQQNYCVRSVNPLITTPGWQPGCLNNPYGAQQQCNAIQQMISGCPNQFGQQQCGGLTLMLNKCPAGSYNPNNPQNPYNYPQPTCTITVSPQNAQPGQPVTIQWQSQGAQYANISGLGQVGPNGSTTAYPQGPTTYQMSVIGYGNQQGQCQGQYGSGGGTSGEPTAQISCQPLKADVGMQVAVSYACQNSSTSVGSGFSTGGALSGSSIITVAAPSFGEHTVNYGLTCTSQGKTHSAQCTIDVNKAAIVLTTVPKSVKKGGEALIGWVTSGMEYCTIATTGTGTSTISATSTPTAGSIKTGPLSVATEYGLTCTTKVGSTKIASTTVEVTD